MALISSGISKTASALLLISSQIAECGLWISISRWRIEIDPNSNHFDADSFNDIVRHICYTA